MSIGEQVSFVRMIVGDWRTGKLTADKAMALVGLIADNPASVQGVEKARASAILEK